MVCHHTSFCISVDITKRFDKICNTFNTPELNQTAYSHVTYGTTVGLRVYGAAKCISVTRINQRISQSVSRSVSQSVSQSVYFTTQNTAAS